MKRVVKYIIFALIAVVFIGTFVFLYKNSRPDKVKYPMPVHFLECIP